MAKAKKPFEKSRFDKEPRGGPREGSKAEEKADRKQSMKFQQGGITDWEAGKQIPLGKVITEDFPKSTSGKGPRLKPKSKTVVVASK